MRRFSMVTVGTYEAKTRLSELLDLVAAGEEVAITRHGEEIARLVPVTSKTANKKLAERVELWRKRQRHVRLNGLSIKELKNAGRR
jgi:prevent-host-death family protein